MQLTGRIKRKYLQVREGKTNVLHVTVTDEDTNGDVVVKVDMYHAEKFAALDAIPEGERFVGVVSEDFYWPKGKARMTYGLKFDRLAAPALSVVGGHAQEA